MIYLIWSNGSRGFIDNLVNMAGSAFCYTSRRTYVSVLLLIFHDSLLICLSFFFISLYHCRPARSPNFGPYRMVFISRLQLPRRICQDLIHLFAHIGNWAVFDALSLFKMYSLDFFHLASAVVSAPMASFAKGWYQRSFLQNLVFESDRLVWNFYFTLLR